MKTVNHWKPLKRRDWDEAKARHLALRLGYSAHPKIVSKVHELGPDGVISDYLVKAKAMPAPRAVDRMRDARDDFSELTKEERRKARRELQRAGRESYAELALQWYGFAAEPRHSFQEKMVGFFSNVWVVAFQGVKNVPALFEYQEIIRNGLGKSYPELCHDLAQSRAMVRYLNLFQNRKNAPNENFAREFFELFTLGEGNYSEEDIKEAARALTGFAFARTEKVRFRPALHDAGLKTIFGQSGKFVLEDVIRVTFEQPAASRFLPQELSRFYLTETPLADDELSEISKMWSESGYDLEFLYRMFFGSALFYRKEFQGNMIKSPEHFYLGLLQDLELDVVPLPRSTFRLTRLMGQAYLNPPNVRGWQGGKHWINSATLSARNQLVQSLLRPIDESKLNADEVRALEAARSLGKSNFHVDPERVAKRFSGTKQLAAYIEQNFYASNLSPDFSDVVGRNRNLGKDAVKEVGRLLSYGLSLPAYHLC